MQHNSPRQGWVVRSGGMVLVGTLCLALSGTAAASGWCGTDDRRARETEGRGAATCRAIGLGTDTMVGSVSDGDASDGNVSGTVGTNEGWVQHGRGQELDVTVTDPATVVVDAVVVKGGITSNVYERPGFLPPTLQPDQHYIAPLNWDDRVPEIRHWFVCYHLGPPVAAPEVPAVLALPLVGGVIFATWTFVSRRRRSPVARIVN